MLRYVIIFSAHLMMALKVQAQCESPAVGENLNMTEISDQQTFPEFSTVKFKCSTGYIPERTSASRSITCIGNQWSKLQLQCKKKSCGKPGEILNGKYLFPEGIRYGAKIKAQCNEGYQLIGDSERNCRETGWDKTHPVCEVVKCINPPSVPDGVFEPEEEVYNYGDGVYYSCKRGLDLLGPSKLTCSNDGTFQPAPPRCLLVTCERPEILNAVRIEGKSPPYKYSDFVRYRCNKGYKMEGSDFLICKEDGWDPPPPQCMKICDPQTIQNAVIVGISSLYRYKDSVQIRCNEGYKTVRSDHLTCGVNGWSPGFSPCTAVTCLPPSLIHNGQFNPQKELYEYGNRVTFTCNEGFKLKGPASSSCTEHGIFQPSPPQCEEICDPQAIQNAVIVGNSSLYRYNDSVQIRCNKGYKTVGSDRLTCGENGWSPGFSPCTVVTCERPEILYAVRVHGKSPPYKYRDFVRYWCNKGYKMKGSYFLICKEDGWDPPPPQCTIVTCLPPTLIHNGQFNPQKELYEYGNRVTFTCNEGFKLKGSASSSCTEDGIFQPSPPQCEVVTCSSPPLINNGKFNPQKELYNHGNRVTFTCNEGFKLKGPASSSCTKDGIFQPSSQCQVKSCGNPGDISHGKYLTPDGIVFGATATAQCDKGYTLVEERTRNCRDDGWDGRDPVCEEVKCEPPPSIQNGSFEPMDEVYNYILSHTLVINYTLIGASAVSCSDNGTFSPPPRCSFPDTKLIPILVNVSSSVPPAEQTTPKSMD